MRFLSRAYIENALCLVLLTAVAAAVMYPALFGGKTPLDASALLFQPPWQEARPDGLADGADATAQALRYYPWAVFLHESMRNHELPLWNPLEGCGTPFFALWRTRCLSPFSIPLYLLAPAKALGVSFFLKLIVAGFAAYYAVRRFGFPAPLALAAGVAFELSGHVFGSLPSPISDVTPWFPLLLLITERLALGQARYWPIGALLVALMLLGGAPETVIATAIFCALYLIVRLRMERATGSVQAISALAFIAIFACAAGMVALQIAPFVEYTKQTDYSIFQDNAVPTRVTDTVAWFLPRFFGAGSAEMTRGLDTVSAHSLALFHVGLAQILFVPLWIALRRFVVVQQRRRVEAMLAGALLMTLLALFAGSLLERFPFLARIHPDHLLTANALALAFLAVAAADEWLALDPDEAHATVVRLAKALPVFLVVGAALLLASYGQSRVTAPPLLSQLATAGVVLAAVLAILVLTLLRPSHAAMGYGLALVTAAQLYLAFQSATRFEAPAHAFPETQFILSLKEGGSRISGSGALSQWPLAGNLIPQIYSSGGVLLKRQEQFLSRLAQDPLLIRRTGAPALLLTKDDIQGAFASVRPNLKIRRVYPSGAILFEDLEMKPRAWMTYEARATDRFAPELLSSTLPPLLEGALPSLTPSARPSKATVVKSSNTRVTIHVEDTPPGMLVLSDTFYPGWKATVDNNPTPVVAVDGLFRGVALEQGPHDVEFVYASRTLGTGLTITIVSTLITAAASLRLLFWPNR